MSVSFRIVVSDDRADEVRGLAHKNDLREEEVLRQLVDIGFSELDESVRI